jgi:hypothetical protein
MAYLQVVDEREGLQIWRVGVNILNKQLLTADKGFSCSLCVGLTTPHCKIQHVTKCYKGALDLQTL